MGSSSEELAAIYQSDYLPSEVQVRLDAAVEKMGGYPEYMYRWTSRYRDDVNTPTSFTSLEDGAWEDAPEVNQHTLLEFQSVVQRAATDGECIWNSKTGQIAQRFVSVASRYSYNGNLKSLKDCLELVVTLWRHKHGGTAYEVARALSESVRETSGETDPLVLRAVILMGGISEQHNFIAAAKSHFGEAIRVGLHQLPSAAADVATACRGYARCELQLGNADSSTEWAEFAKEVLSEGSDDSPDRRPRESSSSSHDEPCHIRSRLPQRRLLSYAIAATLAATILIGFILIPKYGELRRAYEVDRYALGEEQRINALLEKSDFDEALKATEEMSVHLKSLLQEEESDANRATIERYMEVVNYRCEYLSVLRTFHKQIQSLVNSSDLEAAERLVQRFRDLSVLVNGENSYPTAEAYYWLGVIYEMKGNKEAAATACTEGLDRARTGLQIGSIKRPVMVLNLLILRGRITTGFDLRMSEADFTEAIDIAREMKDKPALEQALYGLGLIRLNSDDFHGALPLLREAYNLGIYKSDERAAHQALLLSNLAVAEVMEGHTDKALRLIEDVDDAVQAVGLSAETRASIALAKMVIYDEAQMLSQFADVAEEYRQLYNRDDLEFPLKVSIASNLAKVELMEGHLQEARKITVETINAARDKNCIDPYTLAKLYERLTAIEHDLGNYQEGMRAAKTALALYKKCYRENAPIVIASQNNFGVLLAKSGEFEEAKKQLRIALSKGAGVLESKSLSEIQQNLKYAESHRKLGTLLGSSSIRF